MNPRPTSATALLLMLTTGGLSFVMFIFTLVDTGSAVQAPVLTIPTG